MSKTLRHKRWSRPASIAFSLLFIAIMYFALLPPMQSSWFGGVASAFVPPTVGSMSSTVNSGCSVTFWGNITVIGGLTIDERGFEWGTAPGVYTWEWHEHGSWGIGNFTYTWTSADDDTLYYWRARAVNDDLQEGNGIEENFTTNAVPAPTVGTMDPVTNITTTTALAHGNVTDYGDPCEHIDIRGFEWGLVSGVYTGNETEVGMFIEEPFSLTIHGLPVSTLIFYRAHAFNTHLVGYGVEGNFTTLLPLPCAPTNFVATQPETGNVTLTWVVGCYANITMIRVSSEDCPTDVTDGVLAYSGNGTSVSIAGLSLTTTSYCFRAWSENATGNSTDYAETKIGGEDMFGLIFFFGTIVLAFGMTVAASKWKFLLARVVAIVCWMVPGFYLLVGKSSFLDINDTWIQVLGIALIAAAFLPVYFLLRTETTITKTSKSGRGSYEVTEYRGKVKKPSGNVASSQRQEDYRNKIRGLKKPGR